MFAPGHPYFRAGLKLPGRGRTITSDDVGGDLRCRIEPDPPAAPVSPADWRPRHPLDSMYSGTFKEAICLPPGDESQVLTFGQRIAVFAA